MGGSGYQPFLRGIAGASISGGEAFFRNAFGADCKILWLPDVFGYSAALPQIMKQCGINYFMTTKISWNEYDKLPYDTFLWRGIDGSEVLTHFISTMDTVKEEKDWITTYNGDLNPSQVIGCWQRYQQKDLNRDVLLPLATEMAAEARRMAC